MGEEKNPTPLLRAVAITMLNAALSIWCVIYGKWILAPDLFPASNLLMFAQSAITAFTLLLLKVLGIINDPAIGFSLPPNTKTMFLIGLLYMGNVMFGLLSLKFLTVPMFSVLKRLTIPAAFFGELFFLSNKSVGAVFIPIVVMLTGTAIAASYDLHFSLIGYVVGTLSCCSQAASFVVSKKFASGSENQENVWGIVYWNSVVSLVGIVPIIYFDKAEMDVLFNVYTSPTAKVMVHLVGNGLSVLLLNYAIFLNCNVNSPLTVGITGQLKAVLQIFFGIVIFGKTPGLLSGIGVMFNIAGGCWYSYVKYQQQYAKSNKASPPSDIHNSDLRGKNPV